MATKNNIFEDLARVSASVASVAFESVKNIQDSAKGRVNSYAKSADLITRDEFEAFKKIATKARADSEHLVKEFSDIKKEFYEIKKQVQAVVSNIDIVKEQVTKNNPAGNDENNKKLLSELKTFGDNIGGKIEHFENMLRNQQEKIDDIDLRLESAKPEKPNAKAKKIEVPNNTLFDIPENEEN